MIVKAKIRNSERARAFYSLHDRRQHQIINHFVPKIFTVLKAQIRSFLNEIEQSGYHYAKLNTGSLLKIEGITKLLKDIYLKSAYIESNYVFRYLERNKKSINDDLILKKLPTPNASFSLGFDDLAPVIESYFQIRLLNESALPITASTRKLIIKYLISEVDKGKDLQQAIKDFTALALTGDKPKALIRARRIAVQETTKAMSFGGLIGAYMTGIDCEKVWVTSDDERVRGAEQAVPFPHTRLDLNSQVLLGSFWNGEEIKFPGDPDASIENTAGCRCAMYFRGKPKPKKRERRSILNFLNDFLAGFVIGL